MELSNLKQDLLQRRERLLQLVPVALKRGAGPPVQDLADPPDLLAQPSERAYFDLLTKPRSSSVPPATSRPRHRRRTELRRVVGVLRLRDERPTSTS
jgi:hypothetical protein